MADAEVLYTVEEIRDKRRVSGKVQYLIKWEGYGEEENTWEPEQNIEDKGMIAEFENNKQLIKLGGEVEAEGMKRGRGRPPKKLARMSAEFENDKKLKLEEGMLKRGRGRPPKIIASMSSAGENKKPTSATTTKEDEGDPAAVASTSSSPPPPQHATPNPILSEADLELSANMTDTADEESEVAEMTCGSSESSTPGEPNAVEQAERSKLDVGKLTLVEQEKKTERGRVRRPPKRFLDFEAEPRPPEPKLKRLGKGQGRVGRPRKQVPNQEVAADDEMKLKSTPSTKEGECGGPAAAPKSSSSPPPPPQRASSSRISYEAKPKPSANMTDNNKAESDEVTEKKSTDMMMEVPKKEETTTDEKTVVVVVQQEMNCGPEPPTTQEETTAAAAVEQNERDDEEAESESKLKLGKEKKEEGDGDVIVLPPKHIPKKEVLTTADEMKPKSETTSAAKSFKEQHEEDAPVSPESPQPPPPPPPCPPSPTLSEAETEVSVKSSDIEEIEVIIIPGDKKASDIMQVPEKRGDADTSSSTTTTGVQEIMTSQSDTTATPVESVAEEEDQAEITELVADDDDDDGTDDGRLLELEEIIGVTDSPGELVYLVKWKNIDKREVVPARIANIQFPQAVIGFYQKRLTWNLPKRFQRRVE